MKPRHQISFKRRRTGRPRLPQKPVTKLQEPSTSLDVTAGKVSVGERELHFARALSDTEKSVRDASLTALRVWLGENERTLGKEEIARLWKALFYCVWMADKRIVITGVIGGVIGMVELGGWTYLSGGLECVVREWFGVDRHRVDKFYELLNGLMVKGTQLVCDVEGEEPFLKELAVWMDVLDEAVWNGLPRKGLGVALHVLDVYVEKVMRYIMVRARNVPGNTVHKVWDVLLRAVWQFVGKAEGGLLAVGKRVEKRVLGELVALVGEKELALRVKDQGDMISRVSKKVFRVAAGKETADELRKGLYDLRVELKGFVDACHEITARERKKKDDDKKALNGENGAGEEAATKE